MLVCKRLSFVSFYSDQVHIQCLGMGVSFSAKPLGCALTDMPEVCLLDNFFLLLLKFYLIVGMWGMHKNVPLTHLEVRRQLIGVNFLPLFRSESILRLSSLTASALTHEPSQGPPLIISVCAHANMPLTHGRVRG